VASQILRLTLESFRAMPTSIGCVPGRNQLATQHLARPLVPKRPPHRQGASVTTQTVHIPYMLRVLVSIAQYVVRRKTHKPVVVRKNTQTYVETKDALACLSRKPARPNARRIAVPTSCEARFLNVGCSPFATVSGFEERTLLLSVSKPVKTSFLTATL
jgi:hypothetical protein